MNVICNRALSAKNVKITRPTLFNYITTHEEFESYINDLFDLLKSGKLKVKIYKIYDLKDAIQAHKVCLSPSSFFLQVVVT